MKQNLLILALSAIIVLRASAQSPELDTWIINTTGITGSHYESGNTTAITDTASANVQHVYYSAQNVYLRCSGIPAYPTGPFEDGNPAHATNRNYLFRIPRNPAVNEGTLTEVGLGQIGVWMNGVPVYNYADAMSYNNQGIWNRNAVYFENDGFDCAKGHPAPVFNGPPLPGSTPVGGSYHHHQNPCRYSLQAVPASDVCSSYPSEGLYEPIEGTHSPLLGYAFDGFPIYGAYAYANIDGTGGIVRMQSSYRTRDIQNRQTLADGTVLQPAQYGPEIATTPLGAYQEDFEFVDGLGHLDIHNGRFAVTPEYPDGIYAYYATMDENGYSAFPYVLGQTYYGVVATDNFPTQGPGNTNPTSVTINESVEEFSPEPTGIHFIPSGISLNIWPVPADAEAQISISKVLGNTCDFVICDLNGRTVSEFSIVPGTLVSKIDLSLIPQGIYVVRDASGSLFKRLIIAR
ncbi:MAG: YHYH protein [Bacteroidia bacterium]